MPDENQQDGSNEKELSPHSGLACLFGLFGALICIPLGLFSWYSLNLAGWGDGSTGNAVSNPSVKALFMTFPFFVYFICGVVAALSTRRILRIYLAWIAHIFLIGITILAVMVLYYSFSIILFVYAITFYFFTKGWIKILSQKIE